MSAWATELRRVRASCGATGLDIGKGWCLFVSAMDNDLGVDRIGDGEPHPSLPIPTREEWIAARRVVSALLSRQTTGAES